MTRVKVCVRRNEGESVEIYVMNPDGSSPLNLTNNPAFDFEPAWSP